MIINDDWKLFFFFFNFMYLEYKENFFRKNDLLTTLLIDTYYFYIYKLNPKKKKKKKKNIYIYIIYINRFNYLL